MRPCIPENSLYMLSHDYRKSPHERPLTTLSWTPALCRHYMLYGYVWYIPRERPPLIHNHMLHFVWYPRRGFAVSDFSKCEGQVIVKQNASENVLSWLKDNFPLHYQHPYCIEPPLHRASTWCEFIDCLVQYYIMFYRRWTCHISLLALCKIYKWKMLQIEIYILWEFHIMQTKIKLTLEKSSQIYYFTDSNRIDLDALNMGHPTMHPHHLQEIADVMLIPQTFMLSFANQSKV